MIILMDKIIAEINRLKKEKLDYFEEQFSKSYAPLQRGSRSISY
jgi:hypothetical protein